MFLIIILIIFYLLFCLIYFILYIFRLSINNKWKREDVADRVWLKKLENWEEEPKKKKKGKKSLIT